MSIRTILEDADKPLGNTKQQMDELEKALTAYVEERRRKARIDELFRFVNRSDSLDERKYAKRRLAELEGDKQ